MQSFGPLSLTANTLTQVSCSPSAATVYIGNDSPYDVLVSFAVSPPPLVTSANGTADWPVFVQAFHHCVLPTPGNISSPQGSTFAGNVWLLPLNTRNVGLAQNGTVSATANAWVIACLPGEQPPDAYAAPRQTDITSQARVITVPIVPTTVFIETGGMTIGQTLIPFKGLMATVAGQVNIWCFCFGFLAQQFNGAGSASWSRWEIGFAQCDQNVTILKSIILTSFMTTGQTSTNSFPSVSFTPSTPLMQPINPVASAFSTIQLYVKLVSASSSPSDLTLTIQFAVDERDPPYPPPPIGGGLSQVLNSGSGIIY